MYWVSVFTEAAIFAVLALGLDMVWGWCGDFDLAFYGYLALGSYMTFVLTIGKPIPPVKYIIGWHLPVLLSIMLADVVVVGLAAVIGAIALRNLRDIYFAVTTLGAVSALYLIVQNYTPLFDGFNGVYGLINPGQTALNLTYNGYRIVLLFVVLVILFLAYLAGAAAVEEPVRPDAAGGARGRARRRRLRAQGVLREIPRLPVRRRSRRAGRRAVRDLHQRLQPVRLDSAGAPGGLRGDPGRRPGQPARRHRRRLRGLHRLHRADPLPAVARITARVRPRAAPGPHRAPDHLDAQVPARKASSGSGRDRRQDGATERLGRLRARAPRRGSQPAGTAVAATGTGAQAGPRACPRRGWPSGPGRGRCGPGRAGGRGRGPG